MTRYLLNRSWRASRIGLATLLMGSYLLCSSDAAEPTARSSNPGKAVSLASQLQQRLSPGFNLGNTLEAIPTETSWGNPPTSEAYFQAVKASGFRSIRIPVAWSQYADAHYTIRPAWMAHVGQIVKKATKAGLYVVLNVHWDGGWLQPSYAKRAGASAKFAKFWTQIATSFKDYDDHLLFAGTNEVMMPGVYSPPTTENAIVQNGFNQLFVTTVRATGGRNRDRYLVVQAYNADIDNAVKVNLILPRDTVKGRLIMEVHYYSPYDFTLNEKSPIWQWGAKANIPAATETWANEGYVDKQFAKMKAAFIDKGVPVILGEYAASWKRKYPGMNAFRKEWDRYITHSAVQHGMIPMYWDAGGANGLFDRATGGRRDPDVIKLLVAAAK